MVIETMQVESFSPGARVANHAMGFALWLRNRMMNPAPLQSSEWATYVGWVRTKGAFGVVPQRVWWQTLTLLLGESQPDWQDGKVSRVRPTVPSSDAPVLEVLDD